MRCASSYSRNFRYAFTFLKALIVICIILIGLPAVAQNTKGDRPAPDRETRFKTPSKKKSAKLKPGKRVRAKSANRSLKAYVPRKPPKGGERAGRPIRPVFSNRKPRETQKAWKGDIAGRSIRTRQETATTRYIYPQTTRYRRNLPPQSPKPYQRLYSNQEIKRNLERTRQAQKRPIVKRKVVPRSASRSFTARKSINPWAQFRRPEKRTERAYTRDIAGRKLRTRNFESKRPVIHTSRSSVRLPAAKSRNLYPRRPEYFNYSPQKRQRSGQAILAISQDPGKKAIKKRKVTPRSASRSFTARKSINIWARFPRPKRKSEQAYVGDIAGKKLRRKNFQSPRPPLLSPEFQPYYGKKGAGRRYGGTTGIKQPSGGQNAWRGDIARRRIRERESKSRSARFLQGWGFSSITKHGEDKPGKSPVPVRRPGIGAAGIGKYQGNRLQRRGPGDQGIGYSGAIKARKPGAPKTGMLGRSRVPGAGKYRIDRYTGNLRQRGFNDQGEEFPGFIKRKFLRGKGAADVARYQGNLRRRGFNDQGEEFSGSIKRKSLRGKGAADVARYQGNLRRRGFNDQGEEFSGSIKRKSLRGKGAADIARYQGNLRQRGFNDQGEEFSGFIKRKSLRGKGTADIARYQGNLRQRGFNDQGEEFTGFIKRKSLRGRGTADIARYQGNLRQRGFNDQGEEFSGFIKRKSLKSKVAIDIARYQGNLRQRGFNDQGEEFSGFIKARKPAKGGGSVSGKLWNNKGRPTPAREPGISGTRIAKYQGNLRMQRVFNDQGEEFTGYLKARKPAKGGGSVSGKLWNNKGEPIPVREPGISGTRIAKYRGTLRGTHAFSNQGEEYSGRIRQSQLKRYYIKNPNAADEALKKKKPHPSVFEATGLITKVRKPDFSQYRKRSNEADNFEIKVRREGTYGRAPYTSRDAIKSREPGRAMPLAAAYQGNIKMRKFDLLRRPQHDLHPDAKFVKQNKNNVDEERDMITNLKLLWGRWFGKNATQPSHLKTKVRKPRYDKGEQGLWYD